MERILLLCVVCTPPLTALLLPGIASIQKEHASTIVASGSLSRGTPLSLSRLSRVHSDEVIVVNLANEFNFQYMLDLNISGVIVKCIVDTGSFSLITSSTHCDKSSCVKKAFKHELADSSYKQLAKKRIAHFASGDISMRAAEANVSFGPGLGPRTLQLWEIEKMDQQMTALWETTVFDAILGFAMTDKVPKRGKDGQFEEENTFLHNFNVASFALCFGNAEAFSFKKDLVTSVSPPTPSRLYIGATDSYDFTWLGTLNVMGDRHWAVKLSSVSLVYPGRVLEVDCMIGKNCVGVIDSGTGVITAPPSSHRTLMFHLSQQIYQCHDLPGLPDLRFRIGGGENGTGGVEITLKPSDYVQHIDMDSVATGKKIEHCNPLLIPHNALGANVWVIGAPAMHKYLWEFNRVTRSIRVGKKPDLCPGDAGGTAKVAEKQQAPDDDFYDTLGMFTLPATNHSAPIQERIDARHLIGDGMAD